jgi:hypothetical protein
MNVNVQNMCRECQRPLLQNEHGDWIEMDNHFIHTAGRCEYFQGFKKKVEDNVTELFAKSAKIKMRDDALADEIIARLNELIKNDDVRSIIQRLINNRLECVTALDEHPTVQAVGIEGGGFSVGLLGILNGIVGYDEKNEGGYIIAIFNDDYSKLEGFARNKKHAPFDG